MHLLGLDTNGHSNKPHSKEFERNLKIVDKGVQEIVQLCESFWRHDGRTSYIFTADHGMTDWVMLTSLKILSNHKDILIYFC